MATSNKQQATSKDAVHTLPYLRRLMRRPGVSVRGGAHPSVIVHLASVILHSRHSTSPMHLVKGQVNWRALGVPTRADTPWRVHCQTILQPCTWSSHGPVDGTFGR
eukprot:1138294-Pelagomonas_calceolata.AAC.4